MNRIALIALLLASFALADGVPDETSFFWEGEFHSFLAVRGTISLSRAFSASQTAKWKSRNWLNLALWA